MEFDFQISLFNLFRLLFDQMSFCLQLLEDMEYEARLAREKEELERNLNDIR